MKKIRCTLLCLPLMLAVFAVTGCGEDKKETTTSFPQESTAPESHGMTQTAAPDGAGSQPAEDTTPDESMSGETMPEGTVGGDVYKRQGLCFPRYPGGTAAGRRAKMR